MSTISEITLKPGQLTVSEFRAALAGPVSVLFDARTEAAIAAGVAAVSALADGGPAYGINTGFGKLATTRIPSEDLETLQRNLVLSHAAGVGDPLPDDVVRLILLLKINSLARGHSGIRIETIRMLSRMLAKNLIPIVPERGSVGASGDLAPLAHLAMALIGEGEVRYRGQIMPARDGLAAIGAEPIALGAKEGLALLNGTQVSTALALDGLIRAQALFAATMGTGAMSVDALMGSDAPFDPRIHELRGQEGQIAVAAVYRDLLKGSEIRDSHIDCDRVQDPYSLRCQPQVMGACVDQLRDAERRLVIEANAVTDNPLVFPDVPEVLSGGNFHAEPVAFAADNIALAIAEIGALSERRVALLIDPSLSSGLPAFLVPEPGLNSGFMIAQVTAAALASENKSLAHPASVDSMPTSANQEDHVSMATGAALRLRPMVENSLGIVAVELLCAAQGIDFRRPLKSSAAMEHAHRRLRERVPFYASDRYMAPDIATAKALLAGEMFKGTLGTLFQV